MRGRELQGRVVGRLGAEEIRVELEVDRKTVDAQVLKARFQKIDRRYRNYHVDVR